MTQYISIIGERYNLRVTAATMVAPEFSDKLNLFQPGRADSAQHCRRKFPHGYISVEYKYVVIKVRNSKRVITFQDA